MKRFGPFELEARLGRGGSAEVWRATRRGPHGFARTVALKRLLPERRDAQLERRLLDEARLAAQLAHQNIAQVLEVVEVAGEPAIVMELVDGCELRALVQSLAQDGPPPPGLGAFVAHEVCRALAAAHAERPPILHRDVSPTNVLVARAGTVKLADFGIGKALHDSDERTGSFKGNLGYMAPEQLARAPLLPSADVYAAGVLLWELLTGRRLFAALDVATTGDARLRAIAAPSTLSPSVPRALDAIVARALRASPELRFSDGGEMAEALAPLVHELGFGTTQLAALMRDHAPSPLLADTARYTETQAPPPAPSRALTSDASPPLPARRRRWPFALALAVMLATVAAATAWHFLPPPIAMLDPPRELPPSPSSLPSPSPSPSLVRPLPSLLAVPAPPQHASSASIVTRTSPISSTAASSIPSVASVYSSR